MGSISIFMWMLGLLAEPLPYAGRVQQSSNLFVRSGHFSWIWRYVTWKMVTAISKEDSAFIFKTLWTFYQRTRKTFKQPHRKDVHSNTHIKQYETLAIVSTNWHQLKQQKLLEVLWKLFWNHSLTTNWKTYTCMDKWSLESNEHHIPCT